MAATAVPSKFIDAVINVFPDFNSVVLIGVVFILDL
jgi:hypothetical protein